jgi:mono/diheme cytochrome c family protein
MMSYRTPATIMVAILLGACGGAEGSNSATSQTSESAASAPAEAALSQTELEQGLGPIRDLALAPVDASLAGTGQSAFVTKCSACHKIEERYVAPELGTVLSRRRPEFVMNMMLNAGEMVQRHPEIKTLLAEYFTPMPVQVTDHDEARAILEYLRSAQLASQ